MSYKATAWAWEQDFRNPLRKMIMLYIADCANPENDWKTWHAFRTIAKVCGCSVGSVSSHMSWLSDHGYVTLLRQGRKKGETNIYRLNVGAVEIKAEPPIDCSAAEHKDSDCSDAVDHCSSVGDHRSSPVDHRSAVVDKPVIQPVIETVSETLQPPAATGPEKRTEPKSAATWQAYAEAYSRRYGAKPIRNQTINSQLCKFVDRLGATDAPSVAAYFLTNSKRWYVEKRHAIGTMLVDAEALHNEWKTGNRTTSTQAQQLDRKQNNLTVLDEVIAKRKAEGKM